MIEGRHHPNMQVVQGCKVQGIARHWVLASQASCSIDKTRRHSTPSLHADPRPPWSTHGPARIF